MLSILIDASAFFAGDGGEVVGGELDADDLVAGGEALGLDFVDNFFLLIETFEGGEGDLLGVAAGAGGTVAAQSGQAGGHDGGDADVGGGFGALVLDANFVGR